MTTGSTSQWRPTRRSCRRRSIPRARALDPEKLLASAGWAKLRKLRKRGTTTAAQVRSAFADVVAA